MHPKCIIHNKLSGNLPTLTDDLLVFSVPTNRLSGTIPALHANLSLFDVAHNQIEGDLRSPPVSMVMLNVADNKLTSMTLTTTTDSKLQYLSVAANDIKGGLPTTVPPKLRYANFSGNQMSGSIPEAWLQNSWDMLDLSSNSFSAGLPRNISGNITVLVLANNTISGELPAMLSMNDSLVVLDVRNNCIGGEVPSQWARTGNFSVLKYMGLARNKFTGGVPLDWIRSNDKFGAAKLIFGNDMWHKYKERGFLGRGVRWMKSVCTDQARYNELLDISKKSIDPEVILAPVRTSLSPVVSKLVADLYNYLANNQTGFERRGTGFFQDRLDMWIELPAGYFNRLNNQTARELDVRDLCNNDRAILIVVTTWTMVAVSVVVMTLVYKLVKRNKNLAMEHGAKTLFLKAVRGVFAWKRAPENTRIRPVIVVGHMFAALLYWADIVTDIIVIKFVWRSWPGYVFLSVLLVQYVFTAVAIGLQITQQHRLHSGWWPVVSIALIPAIPILDTIACIIVAPMHIPHVSDLADWHQYYLFRQVTETFFEAIPSAVLQSAVFVIGNSPSSKLYLDQWIFIPSIVVSSMLVMKNTGKFLWMCLDERAGLLHFLLSSITARTIYYRAPKNLPSINLAQGTLAWRPRTKRGMHDSGDMDLDNRDVDVPPAEACAMHERGGDIKSPLLSIGSSTVPCDQVSGAGTCVAVSDVLGTAGKGFRQAGPRAMDTRGSACREIHGAVGPQLGQADPNASEGQDNQARGVREAGSQAANSQDFSCPDVRNTRVAQAGAGSTQGVVVDRSAALHAQAEETGTEHHGEANKEQPSPRNTKETCTMQQTGASTLPYAHSLELIDTTANIYPYHPFSNVHNTLTAQPTTTQNALQSFAHSIESRPALTHCDSTFAQAIKQAVDQETQRVSPFSRTNSIQAPSTDTHSWPLAPFTTTETDVSAPHSIHTQQTHSSFALPLAKPSEYRASTDEEVIVVGPAGPKAGAAGVGGIVDQEVRRGLASL
jgi:hypothetical protein